MMIAARLAGGNLFLPFLGGGFFWWVFFGSTRSTRSTRIFFEGILLGGILFFCGEWGVFWIVSVGKN